MMIKTTNKPSKQFQNPMENRSKKAKSILQTHKSITTHPPCLVRIHLIRGICWYVTMWKFYNSNQIKM